MLFLDKVSHYLNQALIFIAGIFLVAMIVLTCANIFLRLVWMPVSGTFELMGYFGAVLTAFALGYTQLSKGHIAVDIVVLRFSKGVQRVLNG
ncbi:MAG TPA: TRAP transporter small permease subunit, partial [Deltaproteobacteria bacterium]|nr:TRAP transporter small permease subunit [Deltaproteobacteria bacterium]